eukprot:gene13871-15319_t
MISSQPTSINTEERNENVQKIESSVGVAFSGGGIRSAAFSSGVLRRLLHKCVPVDFISTVSGGGFTGSAYLDWKYRHGGKDDPKWHEEFFDQMRRNANTLCTWKNPIRGIFEVLFIIMMVIFIGLVIPVLIWIPMAFPMAYLVDAIFGRFIRAGFVCSWEAGFNATLLANATRTANATLAATASNLRNGRSCYPDPTKNNVSPAILFGALGVALILSFGCYKIAKSRIKELFRILAIMAMVLLCFTFLPWFIEMFSSSIPMWLRIVLLCLGIILWMGIPPLRSTASWCLLLYFYAFVINWRVFQNPIVNMRYNKHLFLYAFWVSVALFMMTPFLWLIQQNTIHAFYRSRLQMAFYTRKSAGLMGCGGITLSDFMPLSRPSKTEKRKSSYGSISDRTLLDCMKDVITLGDLANTKPTYICNVLVDNWKYKATTIKKNTSYTILTLSPHIIERIDDDDVSDFTEKFIGPQDVELSDAMATSAAVVSKHMGTFSNDTVLSLQNLLGLTMGKSWISDKRYLEGRCSGLFLPITIHIIIAMPLLVLPLIEILQQNIGITDEIFVGIFLFFMFITTIISLFPTGKSATSKLERFTRWCIINIFQVRYMREVLRINNIGDVPPAVLYLSDGGHIENLGMLALLKRRLRRIIVADGGFMATEYDVAESLLIALKMAREKLHCSFKGMDGRDIEEDIRDRFIEKVNGKYSRFYRFRVDYYEKTKSTNYETKWVGEGQIILLVPRHPKDCVHIDEDLAWEKLKSCHLGEMKRDRWGTSPLVTENEVDQLTVGCCECCHMSFYQCCSDPICGKFPQHVTANQFFTPAMFSAYHREGYTAALQAAVAEFVAEDNV